MILYLAKEEHEDLLDRLEIGFIKKMIGEFDIAMFLQEDIARLDHVRTLVIDIHCIRNDRESFLSVIEGFKEYSRIKLVLFAEELPQSLLQELLRLEIYDIVTAKTFSDFKGKMKKAIEIGYSKEEAYQEHLKIEKKEAPEQRQYSFICKGVEIVVYGLGERTGATATACGMGHYLANLGGKVIVCGIAGEELEEIAGYYGYKLQNGKLSVNERLTIYSADYPLNEEIIAASNFLIVDMGRMPEELYQAKITIVTSYAKEKDLKAIEKLSIQQKADFFLLRSAEEDKKEKIQKRLKGKQVLFVEYMPGYFMEEAPNAAIYREMATEYIIERGDNRIKK